MIRVFRSGPDLSHNSREISKEAPDATDRRPRSIVLALVIGGAQSAPSATQAAQQRSPSTPTTSAASSPARKGPEAGVWVIAETTDLPTKFARIVVTDDRGRYVIPDLPKATLRRVGARLRPRRFAARQGGAGQAR